MTGVQTCALPISGPAVVTVLPDINKPRIPSLKQILAAKKKTAEKLGLDAIGLDSVVLKEKTLSISGTVMERKNIQINSGGMPVEEAAQKLIQQLKADGSLA